MRARYDREGKGTHWICSWEIDRYIMRKSKEKCEEDGGIWVECDDTTNEPCASYCTESGVCVPEMSTIALLATGLICMAGYLRRRRKEE